MFQKKTSKRIRRSKEIPSEYTKVHPADIIVKHVKARRYVECQHRFAPYNDIVDYLKLMAKDFPDRIRLEIIGESKEGRDIYLAAISKNLPYASLGTIIEAGSNGSEWYAITSALFLIDYFVRSPNSILLMDYYIIPCVNPDAYDRLLRGAVNKAKRRRIDEDLCSQKIDLSSEFPTIGECQPANQFVKLYDPEILGLYRVIERYKKCCRMFLSLRENGKAILYPWGYSTEPVPDEELLRKAVLSAQKILPSDLTVGNIAEKGPTKVGTVVDYVKFYHPQIKYVFAMHINNDRNKSESKILEVAEEACKGVRAIGKAVFKYYRGLVSDLVDVTVKIPNKDESKVAVWGSN